MRKLLSILAISCAFSTFVCDSYAANNLTDFRCSIDAEFSNNEDPDLLKCIYLCAKHNVVPIEVEEIRRLVESFSCDFTRLQFDNGAFDWNQVKVAWGEISDELDEYCELNMNAVYLQGDTSPSELWNTLFCVKEDGTYVNIEGLFDDDLGGRVIEHFEENVRTIYCGGIGNYAWILAKHIYGMAELANEEGEVDDAIEYLKAAQVFVALTLYIDSQLQEL